jgi:alpha-L-fucosidase
VGNEHGFAGETFWSTIDKSKLVIGGSDSRYLNTGDPGGNNWIVGQCDVSIRPGWFYHASEDTLVKTPEQLMDIYYKSVGRNGVLLLNLPPDRRGLIHENDVASLLAFRNRMDLLFSNDLSSGATLTMRKTGEDQLEATLELTGLRKFDHIVLGEEIEKGQRISRFHVDAKTAEGEWTRVAEATTIGYKRILQIDPVTTSMVRVVIEASKNPPLLSEVGLYYSGN